MKKTTFKVTGMTCAACSARVEKAVKKVAGVSDVSVNLLTGTLSLLFLEEDKTNEVIEAVTNSGYGIEKPDNSDSYNKAEKQDGQGEVALLQKRLWLSLCFLVPLMYLTMGGMIGAPLPDFLLGDRHTFYYACLQMILTLPVLYLNRVFFIRGFKNLCSLSPNMDSLVALGASASVLYGGFVLYRIAHFILKGDFEMAGHYRMSLYFESAAMICVLITLGKWLEAKSKRKTTSALEKLLSYAPDVAWVERDGQVLQIPANMVNVGEVVLVKAGMKVPVDGVVVEGESTLDQSAMTGESMPQSKGVGDKVISSSINLTGALRVKAEKIGEDTSFSKMLALVEAASATKAPIAKLADRVAGVFVPCVMGISLLTFIIWLVCGATFEFALTCGITILVIACPCALGLATPVAIMVGVGEGAEHGLLIKSGEALETAHKVNMVVFDKTGTLTVGKPHVTDFYIINGSKDKVLALAGGLEVGSAHPLARAISNYAESQDALPCPMHSLIDIPGKGISGKDESEMSYYCGNASFVTAQGVDILPCEDVVKALTSQGKTVVYLADSHVLLAVFGIADTLKDTTKDALSHLCAMGIETVMLTGDNHATATHIAEDLPLNAFHAELLPEDKEQFIARAQTSGKVVAMVGDGINDAPSLARADVGIAIGRGTDVAIESADIVLVGDDIEDVVSTLKLSRAVIRVIKENLFWAFFYNVLCIPVAAGVFFHPFGLQITPIYGAAAMSVSSVFVVLNALRLKYVHIKPKANINQIQENQNDMMMEEKKEMFTIKIQGMMCGHCVAHVKKALEAVEGVSEVMVSLEEGEAKVCAKNVTMDTLKAAVTEEGYTVLDITVS